MMTQEEYMDLLALRRHGKTIAEIATELDYHSATVPKWLRAGGPPPARTIDPAEAVVDARWAARIDELTRPPAEKCWPRRCSRLSCSGGSGAGTGSGRARRSRFSARIDLTEV